MASASASSSSGSKRGSEPNPLHATASLDPLPISDRHDIRGSLKQGGTVGENERAESEAKQDTDGVNEETIRGQKNVKAAPGWTICRIPVYRDETGDNSENDDTDRVVSGRNGELVDPGLVFPPERRRKRGPGRPKRKRDDDPPSVSSGVKEIKKQQGASSTPPPRRSSRVSSQSVNNELATPKKEKVIAKKVEKRGRPKRVSAASGTCDGPSSKRRRVSKKISNGAGEKKSSDDNEYEVERIVSKRKVSGTTQYLVKWKGYTQKHNTWEPALNLKKCPEVIRQFNQNKD